MSPFNRRLFLFVLICNGFPNFFECRRSHLKLFEDCDSTANYPSTFHVTLKTVGDNQFMDGIWNLTIPFNNTIHFNVTVEMLIASNYQYLFTIKERKACDALNKYFGEFWYDLERYAQLIPGMCPVPQGVHRFHNYPLEFEKITTLVNFPVGNLRLTTVYYDSNNQIYSCFFFVFEHVLI